MELINLTKFPADLYRGMIDDVRLFGSVFARVTYHIVDSVLAISPEQPWKVSAPPWNCEYCAMDSDEIFYKGGVDVFVFGSAKSTGDRESDRVDIRFAIGEDFVRYLTVFGERIWKKESNRLVAGSPHPFKSMPITLENAFGGKDQWDGLDITFQYNPWGKGFYLSEESAEGSPLPNIEDPNNLIKNWNDQPDPVGLMPCPSDTGIRLRKNVIFDEEKRIIKELKPGFFNSAFPDMIAPRVKPGDQVVVEGMHKDGPIYFVVPDTILLTRLQFGDEVVVNRMQIDQLGIEIDKKRVFISYRYPFRYKMIPLQYRSCELYLKVSSSKEIITIPATGEI